MPESAPSAFVSSTFPDMAAVHEAFSASRDGVYIGGREYFERLDAHAEAEGPPLVVLGASGGGKSALLARWRLKRREAHPEELLVTHFVGASPAFSDWSGMLRRLMGELIERFAIAFEIPSSPDELRPAFANLLHMAAAKGRVVLIIDALDQLEDREGARELLWLPPRIPANVRLVVSTLPGAPLQETEKRGWPTLTVKPLRLEERKLLIDSYPAQHTKQLSPERSERIAAAPQSANPLFLRALLEALRVSGQHETLDERIAHYLVAADPEKLYGLILVRYEADYDCERPNLVRDTMSLIWAARRGLSESELLDLLGADGRPLQRELWSSLYQATAASLIDRAGCVTFSHECLRAVVRRRYVPTSDAQAAVHLRLANYFGTQERRLTARGIDELPWQLAVAADAQAAVRRHLAAHFGTPEDSLTARGIDELPWQLAEATSCRRLYDLLAELPFLDAALEANKFDVGSHWARVERGSNLHLVDAYRTVIEHPRLYSRHVLSVASLLADTGHSSEARGLLQYLAKRRRKTGDRAGLQRALGEQARILRASDDLEGAMALALLKKQERICRELDDLVDLGGCIANQAKILYVRGDLDGAITSLKEGERICRKLGDKAVKRKASDDLDGAMALLKEQERMCRELGDPAGLQSSLNNQALILKDRGDPEGAMALLKEQERMCRELGDPAGLQASLGDQALILKDFGDREGPALRKRSMVKDLFRRIRKHLTPSAEALDRFEKRTAWPMLALSVSIIPLIVAQVRISPLSPWAGPLVWVDLAVWALFAAEFITRLCLAPAPRGLFVRRNWLDLLLVLIPPTMLMNLAGNFAEAGALRSARAVRAIRVLRAGRAMVLLARGVKASRRSLVKHPIAWVLLVATFVTVGAGIVVRVIEANRGSHINSLTDAFWWAIYNLSTLGSNDYRPTTNVGRGLEIILALLGLGLFGLLAGSLGAFFVDKEENAETQHDYEKISARVGHIEAALAKLAPASGEPQGASVDEPQDPE